MQIVVHREIPDDPELRNQWNRLIDQMESPEVFYTYEWARAVQSAYGSVLVPFLILAYEGESLVGVASLAADQEQRSANLLGGTTSDYCELISHPSQRGVLATAVVAELSKAGIRKLDLANLPADSATGDAMRSAAKAGGFHAFFRPAYLCAQVNLGEGDARGNLKGSLLRKTMYRRNMSKLGKEGPVALNHARTWDEIEPLLQRFSVAHVARFLATDRISNLAKADRRRLLEELAKGLSSLGGVMLTRLMAGEKAVAWNYGFDFRGKWFWYQPTFDTRAEALSPGYCLLTNIVSEACDRPDLGVVDLGLGAEGYKDRFANGTRATLHGTLQKSLTGYWSTVARYRAASAVKSRPRVEGTLRRGLVFLRRMRKRVASEGPRGVALRGLTRLRRAISSRDEVFFYEYQGDAATVPGSADASPFELAALDYETLALGAIQNEGDAETYNYLMRSAQRLRSGQAQGFALMDSRGVPLHFCWAREFDGFYMEELRVQLEGPFPNAAMIFDCWTPRAVRGRNYYAAAVSRLAQQLVRTGRVPWIFSAATNQSSIRGLESSGFERRYSMVRKKLLWFEKVTRLPYVPPRMAQATLHAKARISS